MNICMRSFLLLGALSLGACSSEMGTNAAAGGAMGTAAGAGTGAIIGSVISNGDVGESALLGGAIGLPLGILGGVMYTNYSESSQIEENNERIINNREHILQQERELNYMRNKIREDSSSDAVQPDPDLIEHQHLGPSLGNVYR